MRHLIVTPNRNSAPDRSDFSGAFKIEADRYAAFWRSQGDVVDLHRFDLDVRASKRVASVVALLSPAAPISRLATFCHGWRTGVQLGLSCKDADDRADLAAFASSLAAASTDDLAVALYCCSTGASPDEDPTGDGGFADALRDALVAAGRPRCQVFAHRSSGHTTRSASIRYFLGDTSKGGVDPVPRGSPEYKRLDARMDDKADPLRFRAPYLTPDALLAELRA